MAERDILTGASPDDAAALSLRARIAAFIPITVALIGVAAVLTGGISASHHQTTTATAVDAMTTGSIATPDAAPAPLAR